MQGVYAELLEVPCPYSHRSELFWWPGSDSTILGRCCDALADLCTDFTESYGINRMSIYQFRIAKYFKYEK